MMIRKIETGSPYVPTITRWPETAHFNYDPEEGLCQLTIFMPSPSIQDIGTIRRRPGRFGIGMLEGLVFVTYDWPGLKGDAPYSWHAALRACLLPDTVPLPDIPLEGWPIMIVLVDANTGLVAAWRMTTMSVRVSSALVAAIHDEAAVPFDPAEYVRRVREVYGRTSPVELRRRAVMDPEASTDDREQAHD